MNRGQAHFQLGHLHFVEALRQASTLKTQRALAQPVFAPNTP